MKKELSTLHFIPVLILLLSINCMPMGLKLGGHMMARGNSAPSIKELLAVSGKDTDKQIDKAVKDLSGHELAIISIAVWRIKTQTAGLNVEDIRRKLITRLIALNRFKVVSRERLDELLEEHLLSSTGAIDEKSAVEFGELIGVDGLIDGYAAIENNRFILNLTLFETKTGVIVWAKTVE